jgi:predicted kinase
MEIVMFIGIPATGKSSFYQERFAASHLRINRDMLKTEPRISSLFEWCLERKQPCVIDNTNTTRAVRSRWIRSAREKGIPVIGYFFESKLEGALERNSQREGVARIRDAGVRYHHSQLELPSLNEGFSTLFFVRLVTAGFVVEPWNDEI